MILHISYFYQIRFFKPNMIPLSTAVWDPKWFHRFESQDEVFIDKNGVINGLRIPALMPGSACEGLCLGHNHCVFDPESCAFLCTYREQLNQINMCEFVESIRAFSSRIQELLRFKEEPDIVFIVHEAPNNQCSERVPLLQWFQDNNVACKELTYPIGR